MTALDWYCALVVFLLIAGTVLADAVEADERARRAARRPRTAATPADDDRPQAAA